MVRHSAAVEGHALGTRWSLATPVVRCHFLTVNLTPLLLPVGVVTVTSTRPYLALLGTWHLICMSFQET